MVKASKNIRGKKIKRREGEEKEKEKERGGKERRKKKALVHEKGRQEENKK